MFKQARILIVLAALFVAACVPETETFLSEPGAQPNDKRLIGTWYWLDRDGGEIVLLTVRRTDDKTFSFIWTETKPSRISDAGKPAVQFVRYTGHTTKLGKLRFLNLRLADAKAWKTETPKRFIMRYWLGKRGLRIAFMKNDVIKGAIEKGTLAGRLVKGDPVITAERKALIAFIRKTGAKKVFAKPTKPLKRLRATES